MSLYTIPPQLSLSFGSFDYFCNQVGLVLCPLVGGQQGTGMEASCKYLYVTFAGSIVRVL